MSERAIERESEQGRAGWVLPARRTWAAGATRVLLAAQVGAAVPPVQLPQGSPSSHPFGLQGGAEEQGWRDPVSVVRLCSCARVRACSLASSREHSPSVAVRVLAREREVPHLRGAGREVRRWSAAGAKIGRRRGLRASAPRSRPRPRPHSRLRARSHARSRQPQRAPSSGSEAAAPAHAHAHAHARLSSRARSPRTQGRTCCLRRRPRARRGRWRRRRARRSSSGTAARTPGRPRRDARGGGPRPPPQRRLRWAFLR